MASESNKNPFMDMFQDFGKSMSIPGPDLNDMMDYHRKNLQALQAAVQVNTENAQTLMNKQRETLEQTLADIFRHCARCHGGWRCVKNDVFSDGVGKKDL